MYQCFVSNGYGSVERTFLVEVTEIDGKSMIIVISVIISVGCCEADQLVTQLYKDLTALSSRLMSNVFILQNIKFKY